MSHSDVNHCQRAIAPDTFKKSIYILIRIHIFILMYVSIVVY